MPAVWPAVAEAVVALQRGLEAWSGIPVKDGPPGDGAAPHAYGTVGFVEDEDAGGSFTRTEGTVDGLWLETGTVRGEIIAWNGRPKQPELRAQVFALFDAFSAAVAVDPYLGGVLLPGSSAGLTADVFPGEMTNRSEVRLVWTLSYTTDSL